MHLVSRTFLTAAILSLLLIGCNEGVPIITESTRGLSPDLKWEFTSEFLDNGMGFGMGADYYEVHIHRPGVKVSKHGDKEPSAVFYIESAYQAGDHTTVQWVDSQHLLVRFAGANKPGRAIKEFNGISIEYQPFDLPRPKSTQSSP